jgi:hypothetical protein
MSPFSGSIGYVYTGTEKGIVLSLIAQTDLDCFRIAIPTSGMNHTYTQSSTGLVRHTRQLASDHAQV